MTKQEELLIEAADTAQVLLDELSKGGFTQKAMGIYQAMANTNKVLGDAIKEFKERAKDNMGYLDKITEPGDLCVEVTTSTKSATAWKQEAITLAELNAKLRKQAFSKKAFEKEVKERSGVSTNHYVTVKTRG